MKNITITEVAKAAGVSISSVSRYLKDPNSIKPIAAVKVAQAIRDMNYVPSTFAQNLRRGHSNTIGVIVPKLTPYFAEACTAINRFLNQYGYLMIICDTEYNPDQERYYIGQLIKQGVAGIILASAEQNEEMVLKCLGDFQNVVYFIRPVPSAHFSSVNEDIFEGGRVITQALINKGYHDFLLLSNSVQFKNHKRKAQVVEQELLKAGISNSHISHVSDIIGDGRAVDVIAEYLNKSEESKCLICMSPYITENATIALGSLNANDRIGIGGYVLKNFEKKFRRDIVRCIQEPYEVGLKSGEIMLQLVKLAETNKGKPAVEEHIIKNEVIVPIEV